MAVPPPTFEAVSSLELGSVLWPDWLASEPWGALASRALRFQAMPTCLVSMWTLETELKPSSALFKVAGHNPW